MADFEKWALIVVDMQNDFLAEEGYYDEKAKYKAEGLAREEVRKRLVDLDSTPPSEFRIRSVFPKDIVDKICYVLNYAKEKKAPVAFLKAVYDPAFELKPRFLADKDRKHYPYPCKPNTWGAD